LVLLVREHRGGGLGETIDLVEKHRQLLLAELLQ